MHVIDAVLDSFSNLFQSHRYSPLEKLYFRHHSRPQLEGKYVNSKTLKSIEEIATAVAIVHNLVRIRKREGNTNLTVPPSVQRTKVIS